jgi:hypothetical protein
MKKNLLLMMMCVPVILAAQNGVAVSGLAVDAGTVTFNVSWDKNAMSATPWSDTVWVFVDYNNNGVMERLPVTSATVSAGTVTKVSNNDKGVWVAGNARTQGSFSATVKLLTEVKDIGGACVYGSNYPPVGEYTSATNISFTGTPDYKVVLEKNDKSTYTATIGKGESLSIPSGEAILSFTDKTAAPGKLSCIPSTVYDLTASASSFCAGGTGVTFALSGTESGRSYELYKDGAPTAVAALTGTGGGAQAFTAPINVRGTYTAKALASEGYCEAAMSGTHTVASNSLPMAPVIAKPDDVCLNGGSIVFTATDYSGSLEWVSNGGGVVNGNTVTFAGTATGTKTVTAQSAQTHTNAPVCYSAEVTQSASVLALPATPGISVSASTVCLGTYITFRVSSPVSGATYTWTGAAGTASGTGDGTYTVSGATTGTKSVTVYAQLASGGTTCQSGNASLSALVSQPGADGQPSTPCGCATGTTVCGAVCRASCCVAATPCRSAWVGNVENMMTAAACNAACCAGVLQVYTSYSYAWSHNDPDIPPTCSCYMCR